ncbi:MAG: M23 family metallopeptidase [Planctomycetes bacterium]|nr:M23 family metallopeptidase [Planctomycetota bacterium]
MSGCETLSLGGANENDGPVRFEPAPPRSVQTQSLKDVRFRRFASSEGHIQSEWTQEPSIWPLEHPHRLVISRFGPRGRDMHKGIDIKAPKGTPIMATADGQISFAGVRSGYGNVVEIRHGDGVESVYGHMDTIEVTEGTTILQGEIIGTVGDTGNASTPHVHYEVRIDGQCFDPWLFLPAVDE